MCVCGGGGGYSGILYIRRLCLFCGFRISILFYVFQRNEYILLGVVGGGRGVGAMVLF